ncbi:hypothetical protein [Geobacter sp. SVR]|uniref:hypothetical protein n=1 Tax=Geobacter sp. SVR TaxID=2495594 RepID=UPI00143EF661|nr:hypothetical protein [Geobacter sp. SVR]BCS54205.1 hypothetical protein GSVR_25130 [Geobacter sp. SVR]GCF85936.1 hypothetical protein GSbR_25360 [Geobacter sp. SVR]
MMLNLYVQQHQWIVVALLSGAALVLLFWLNCTALWRPRQQEAQAEKLRITGPVSFVRWLTSFMPWTIVLLIIACSAFTLLYLCSAGRHAPTW